MYFYKCNNDCVPIAVCMYVYMIDANDVLQDYRIQYINENKNVARGKRPRNQYEQELIEWR